MPEIIPLGWFHTAMGIAAILSGVFTLWMYTEITLQTRSGQIYLATTLVTAVTALGIYQHGFFGPGHVLAVLTLGALGIGTLAGATQLFGAFSRQLRALSYTATLLFHSVPAVTDGLLRLPTSDPVINSIDDPILRRTYLALLLIFLVGMTLQIRWIRRQQRHA